MNNQWSDNLRKRMEAHEEPAPDGLWNDIEQAMIDKSVFDISSKQKRLRLWARCVGAAAAIIVFGLIGYLSFEKVSEEIAEPTSTFVQEQEVPTSDTTKEILNRESIFPEKNSQPPIKYNKKEIQESKTIISDKDVDIQKDKSTENVVEEASPINQEIKKSEKKYSLIGGEDRYDFTLEPGMNGRKWKSSKWEANLYASNISTGSTNKYGGYGNLLSTDNRTEDGESPSIGEGVLDDIFVNNEYKEVYTDIKHKQPLTVGLSVNYNINEKWSVTSGLIYTMLSSDLRSGSDNYYYNSEQTLHYIGIPLNVNYNIWKNKKISVYVSGGGSIEKNVSGKLTTDYVLDNKLESSQKKNISIDELQWSLNSSIGVQYNFSKKIGIYTEPGVSYYFKNQNEFETIYKEKPFNLKLQLGIRFSLGE